ncbi:hypothetical protein Ahy_A10g050416 [Arachis hypogaea]|uniref:Uncharacterized protein n=1 Tax=Arachis hypogaea TaxID=3818 RepID=A0A445B9E6_ARAHY|nr:hypothetical protein Ahy_A10g050416 [Arachis hypogaea]
MSIQLKTEPGSPPILSSTSNKSLETMSVPELIEILRVKWQKVDYDRVEEVFVEREKKLKTKAGQLEEKFQLQSLARIDAEDKLKKKEQECEKVQMLYETLFKGVKESGLDKETIENLRKKNKVLECENLKLLELKKKYEVDGNAVDELRKKVAELEAEKKNNLDTTTELNDKNGKLVDVKLKAEFPFLEILDRVSRCWIKGWMSDASFDGEHDINKADDPGFPSKVKGEVKEFNDEINDGSLPLQRNKDFHQSHGAAAAEGGSKFQNIIEISGDHDDDDIPISRVMLAKATESRKRKLPFSQSCSCNRSGPF